MKELQARYNQLKATAKDLMLKGNITAYLATLKKASDVKNQIQQLAA